MHTPTLVPALAEGHAVVDVACGALCTFRVATRLPLAMQVARTARQWESESEFREVLLWSAEDLTCCFYLCKLPRPWWPWF